MDDTRIFLNAEISKINFLLENLYAVALRDRGAAADDVPGLAEALLHQASQPGTSYGESGGEEEEVAIRELAQHRIAMFFSGVQERLRSHEAGD
ncbi:hypothetical protein [Novosphingobium sp. JCM 18896]|uniref:hypothetical protein n=1 Tax=Novosphingobium sp. JCM 18896 TaxID=2989731 RepID=UPI0022232298|nr:hypothetical protein [Novosphingobium sp. JCM 18896]MCW1432027.1 hypothetical protein [Novosphingobium sp. JCM 18896]